MKSILFSLGVIAMLSFASCKKEYTCTCTTTTGGVTSTSSATIKDTKKNAETACNNGDATTTAGSIDCELE